MADAKTNDAVPRKATNVTVKRKGKQYMASWKLPSNATSTSRTDRTESQSIQWCFVPYKATKDSKGKVKLSKGMEGWITNWLPRSTGTTSSTLNFNAKTGILTKRKNFYP
mgnify:CR=1 FL=1